MQLILSSGSFRIGSEGESWWTESAPDTPIRSPIGPSAVICFPQLDAKWSFGAYVSNHGRANAIRVPPDRLRGSAETGFLSN